MSPVGPGRGTARDELVEAATADPGAPFAPDIVRELAAPFGGPTAAQFETLRTRLKRARLSG